MDKGKSKINPLAVIIGAPILAFAGLALYQSNKKEEIPVAAHREPQDVRAVPYSAVPLYNDDVALEILANRSNPQLADGLSIRIRGLAAEEASRSNPVYYEIPGLRHHTVGIQVSQGQYSLKDLFVTPQDLDGKVIRVYCTEQSTKKPKLLHESTFRARK